MNDKSKRISKVAKLVSYNFLSVLLSENSLIKLGDFYANVESRKLAREWFALQFYLMIWAISSIYKEDPVGIEISNDFRIYAIEGLTEAGVYSSKEEAPAFL